MFTDVYLHLKNRDARPELVHSAPFLFVHADDTSNSGVGSGVGLSPTSDALPMLTLFSLASLLALNVRIGGPVIDDTCLKRVHGSTLPGTISPVSETITKPAVNPTEQPHDHRCRYRHSTNPQTRKSPVGFHVPGQQSQQLVRTRRNQVADDAG